MEIAPGIFAESVVKGAGDSRAQVYLVTGGAFEHLELESMSSLLSLVSLLSALEADELAMCETPAADSTTRRWEVELPLPASCSAHRRFIDRPDAPAHARAWTAATLVGCLPRTEWASSLVDLAGGEAASLVAEATGDGAAAVLLTVEIIDSRLSIARLDELAGGRG